MLMLKAFDSIFMMRIRLKTIIHVGRAVVSFVLSKNVLWSHGKEDMHIVLIGTGSVAFV